MLALLKVIPALYLAGYVAAADALIWLAAFPFELCCRSLLAQHRVGPPFLPIILIVNGILIAVMALAVLATGELVRRGITRQVRVALPAFARARSKRSGY
jgi:hypothetical protein